MKLQFLYSKNKEREKLLNIYDEYQWFIDNDFPIILPKFYTEIYWRSKNNKKLFIKELNVALKKIYNKNDHQVKAEKIKNSWKKVEQKFFNTLKNSTLNSKDKHVCYISLYGPEGQFKLPNIINLRANTYKDIKNANETIAHELIHLFIYSRVKKLKLNYQQTEGVVDLFFTETKLKKIFPHYELQNMAIHNKKLFQKIKESLNG
ncbi:MAG: hypothetical protein COY66_03880 [Candidatus Kerfeldbacteria bacterium CG_4_10_14_0_8_um_filter_42_10]|uniref:Uncharacterized protein n=1 Tax=Candidatus Kerfeldbacteria bacterium CG_4_10_14_0_8_um_filter_42_10 TaxID=2014248 RepID=A0A2M7RJ25_9BACT|nr:MAG: hypothetical protein COY66_03880 [Candidatus Kerfeldbacteria bacterium CG_4_10_14_0_8_um_filter_42_10]